MSIGPSHRELLYALHTLRLVEAAGVIQREVDPQHVDYGDAAGYAKVPSATTVREAWTAHLVGRTSRAAALAQMADMVAARRQAK